MELFVVAILLAFAETQLKCKLNTSEDNALEGDGVQLKCEAKYSGTNNVSMVWKGVDDAPVAVKNVNTISRSFSVVASAPEVPSFTCVTSFAFETHDSGALIPGLATNSIPIANCSTSAIKVFYSVRNVTLSPSLPNYSPGTVVTCTARGHPSPNFKWQEMENSGTWMDIQKKNDSEFTLTDVSSKKYKCVAMNIVRGKNYNVESREIQFSNTDRFGIGLGIGFGIGLLVAIILATVVFAILVKVRCLLYVQPRSAKKSPDGVVPHQDHEMIPSSRSTTSNGTTLAGEQELAYASLGEDRDANEYASLDERPKVKPKKKSRS